MSYLLPSEPPEEDDSDSQVLYEPEDHSNPVDTGRCVSDFFYFLSSGIPSLLLTVYRYEFNKGCSIRRREKSVGGG